MAQSLRKSTFAEIRNFRENDKKRSHTRLFHELREVTMAEGSRRRSLSQVVIGFSKLEREALGMMTLRSMGTMQIAARLAMVAITAGMRARALRFSRYRLTATRRKTWTKPTPGQAQRTV